VNEAEVDVRLFGDVAERDDTRTDFREQLRRRLQQGGDDFISPVGAIWRARARVDVAMVAVDVDSCLQ